MWSVEIAKPINTGNLAYTNTRKLKHSYRYSTMTYFNKVEFYSADDVVHRDKPTNSYAD